MSIAESHAETGTAATGTVTGTDDVAEVLRRVREAVARTREAIVATQELLGDTPSAAHPAPDE